MMPTRIFLLRHAETAVPNVFHGAESDIGLSAKGVEQAERVAEFLAPLSPDVIICSGMRRAIATATPLAQRCGLPLQIEAELHERKVSTMSGKSFDGEGGIWPDTVRRWMNGDTSFAHPGAESFDDLQARLLPAWHRAMEPHAGKTLVVIAHGVVIKVLLLSLLPGWSNADWQRLGSIDNVGVTELLFEAPHWQALRINDRNAYGPAR
jgi:broad specificity phosphatase PhoE